MTKRMHLTAGVAILALMGSQALADVTPEQVWQSWLDYYKASGMTVTEGGRSQQGDTLILTDTVAETQPIEGDKGNGKATVTTPQISLRDMGDGKVEMTMADTSTFSFSGTDPDGKSTEARGKLVQTGIKMIVSGTPEAMNYDISMPTMTVTLDEVKEDGKTLPMTLSLTLNDSTGTYQIDQTSGHKLVTAMKSKSMDVTVKAEDPEAKSTFDATWKVVDLAADSTTLMPADINLADIGAALKAGLDIKATLTFGPGEANATFEDKSEAGSGPGSVTATDKGGSASFALSPAGMAYDVKGDSGQATIKMAELPFPIDYGYDNVAFAMNMPIMQSDTAAPYGLRMELGGLTMSEGIWSMLDAAKQLPRDPINLLVDLGGTVKVTTDLFDAKNMDSADMPMTFETLDLKSVAVSALGAAVTANGALKFLQQDAAPAPEPTTPATPDTDMTDADTSEPGVLPVGTIEAKGTGVNGLLDKLTAMGLIPEDQVQGFRMMLALFTKADGADSLTSKIDFREDGGIYANDQRIQ